MNGDYTPLFGNKGSVPFFRQITRIMNDGKCCNARPDPVALPLFFLVHFSRRQPQMERKNKILEVLKSNKQYMQTHFMVNSIGLFGSYARNDFHDKSDIDILVTFSEPTFDHYMDLKFYLEDLFGRPVDIVMEKTVKERLKKAILQETCYV
jgi:predicted nucleotidyltransferase